MPANINPQFINSAVITPVAVTAALAQSEGTGTIGTNIFLCVTAGANDAFVEQILWMPTASAASTLTQATVARAYISTKGSGNTTGGTDTFLLYEVVLPAVTAASPTVAQNPVSMPLNYRVPSGSFLLVSNHAAPNASTEWVATPIAGNY
jgi:hypothetical protein